MRLHPHEALLAFRRAAGALYATAVAIRERWRAYEKIEARGMTLLSRWLSPEQRSEFEKYKRFDVIGNESGKRYRICYGTATNVYELDDKGHVVVGWCFRPIGSLVAGDVMLAQKIALEVDERGTLMVAKPFPGSMPPRAGLLPTG
ncbi:hypothetical protein [Bradyrhizobium sp. ORS 111]|uniref:hypothetical protein n=1 Tax=Bradyrhizobium sp. ORS 111 TaxID=1685958 RepID=UPI00388E3391